MNQLRTSYVVAALGFKHNRIPADVERAPTLMADGLHYSVRKGQQGGRRSAGKHRVYVNCPYCTKQVPAGRLHQHCKVHGVHVVTHTAESLSRVIHGGPYTRLVCGNKMVIGS